MFLKTFLRAVEPTSGDIILNGENIKDYKIEDIRKLIGFLSKRTFFLMEVYWRI
jgi:ABC-type multidrug transport system fused ATPase/permease subunit